MKQKVKDIDREVELLALDILDYTVAEGKMPLHTAISSKEFLQNFVSVLKVRDAPEVQIKILYLIKKWGVMFEKQKDIIPNFTDTYITLINAKVTFPENLQ